MRPILFMLRKEFKQIFRTREMIAVIFVVPVIQMLILGFAITNEVKHIKMIIADQDNSRISREVSDAFSNTDRFDIVARETNIRRIESTIHGWHAQIALLIPPGFQRDLQRNLQPNLQVIVDGLDGNTAGVALSYTQGILREYAIAYLTTPRQMQKLIAGNLLSAGANSQPEISLPGTVDGNKISSKNANDLQTAGFSRFTPHFVNMRDRMWYNLNLNSAQYMVPGIVVVLLTIISMMLSSVNLVREGEIGTLEQLMVTPLTKIQLLLGKLIPFLILSFVELAIVLRAAQFIFSIHMQGSYLLLYALATLYLFTTLGLGTFVSTITDSQQQAFFVSWFFMVFMIMMGGLFIPIENMPDILQKLTYLNPMRYFMSLVREIFQKGALFSHLIKDIVPLALFGLGIFTFSVMNFHKRVK